LFGSLSIGRIAGIAIRVHWTLIALIVYFAIVARDAPGPLLTLIGSLLVAVLLHELGHALVARRLGVRVVDITFGLLGGSANLVGMPDKSRVEGWIAAAGPLVNLALAGLALAFYAASATAGQPPGGATALTHFERTLLAHPLEAIQGLQYAWSSELAPLERARLFALGFWSVNLYLGVFNLVPAFPLDGGRILRALLALRLGWLEATQAVVRISRWLVLIGLLILLVAQPSLWCLLLATAAFLWFQGMREVLLMRLRYGASPIAGFARGFSFGGANPFAASTAEPREAEILGSAAVEPVAAEETRIEVEVEPADEDPDAEPGRGQARRPRAWDGKAPRGASDEWVTDLEKFRGRLRRDDSGEG
jgi:Zn-dependent protease